MFMEMVLIILAVVLGNNLMLLLLLSNFYTLTLKVFLDLCMAGG